MSVEFDVSIIINGHREGELLHFCLSSVMQSVAIANEKNISTEVLLVLDRPDKETEILAKRYCEIVSIIPVDFGDLSLSRNFGCAQSRGKYVSFIDGDDLWGHNWILSCFRLAEVIEEKDIIIHPRVNMFFGRDVEPYFWIHPDMRYEKVSLEEILVNNRWTALSFANRSLYLRFPYMQNRIAEGFGYEDWLWHIQTILSGVVHITAEDTIHFIRRKKSGSLLAQSNTSRVLPFLIGVDL